jgi:prepilin-type N-terminal cleavage/methylation domain-containing protein/prepilin-type processing-associated H-X9-DG protein
MGENRKFGDRFRNTGASLNPFNLVSSSILFARLRTQWTKFECVYVGSIMIGALTPSHIPSSIRRVKRGFTLIELIVVVAIISLLAAILFPVFGRARENARRSSCQSNLKQLMLAITQYSQDCDERFPPEMMAVTGLQAWSQFIQPYVKSRSIFLCPSDTSKTDLPASTSGSTLYGPALPLSYGINRQLTLEAHPVYTGILLSQVVQPATTVMLSDGVSDLRSTAPNRDLDPTQWDELPGGFIMETWATARSTSSAARGGPMARHLGLSNLAFVDGHVKAMQIEKWYYNNSPWLQPSGGG